MRTFLHDLFYIPHHANGKMCEKAFMARMAVSVLSIVLCLSAIGITAYAWFSSDVTSDAITIVSATYDLQWTITVSDENGTRKSANTGIKLATNAEAPKTYEIHIEKSGLSTASTGFCVIEVYYNADDVVDEIYHTVQIGKDNNTLSGERNELDFRLTLLRAARLVFRPHWGTSSLYGSSGDYYIQENETVEIGKITSNEPFDDGLSSQDSVTDEMTEREPLSSDEAESTEQTIEKQETTLTPEETSPDETTEEPESTEGMTEELDSTESSEETSADETTDETESTEETTEELDSTESSEETSADETTEELDSTDSSEETSADETTDETESTEETTEELDSTESSEETSADETTDETETTEETTAETEANEETTEAPDSTEDSDVTSTDESVDEPETPDETTESPSSHENI